MNVELTQAAKDEMDKIQGEDNYLRIVLSKSGCCSYSLEFYVDGQKRDDELIEIDGYKFLVTEREKLLLESVKVIDYGRKGIFKDFKTVMR